MSTKPHLKRTRRQLLSFNVWKLRLVFWSSAMLIGITAAIFAIASSFADALYHELYAFSAPLALTVTPVALAFIAWLTTRFFVGTEGSGIPQAIAALSIRDSALRSSVLMLKIAVGKIILTCMGLMSGASIGREGPTVHVGASIMYAVRQFIPLRSRDMHHALILAGGAAGISAAFNTPLAGILFAIEEMSRRFEEKTSGVLIIAVVLSGITAVAMLGNYTYFGSTTATLPITSPTALLAIITAGVIGGLLGGLFSQSLIRCTRRVAPHARQNPVFMAFICGLLISLIAYLADGETYGTGYEEARKLVTGEEQGSLLYPLYKMLATVVSYLSGIPGGIFAPSLSVGAGIGADLARLFTTLPMQALVLLGMVSYFTGVVQTPITAFVIVMEMTDSSALLLPLMAASLIAKGISHLVCPTPIYHALADAYLAKTGSQSEKTS